MKKIKKSMYALGISAAILATMPGYAAFDGTIKMNFGPYHDGGGGEFTGQTIASVGSPLLGNFLTWCLEENQYFSPGATYSYIINTGSVLGGISGQNATDPNTGGSMDQLSIGTAWLYWQFRTGGISITSTAQAGDFQNAIWYLEGEVGGASAGALALINQAKVGTGIGTGVGSDAAIIANSGGAYGVVALNLYSKTPVVSGAPSVLIDGQTWYVVQDQLAIVPETSTIMAGALLLLPFGASTIRILRKNRNK